METFRYGVLGAGRQGTAAAYDLAVRGRAASILLADADAAGLERACERVNRLAEREVAAGTTVTVEDREALRELLEPLDAVAVATPYWFNLAITEVALEVGTSVCDLGGSIPVARTQLGMSDVAHERGIVIVPECGEAPGMANNLVAYASTLLDETSDVVLLDGGIPAEPRPPWNYELTFNINGLTNEYDGTTTWVRDGEPYEVECLDPGEDELVEFDRIGTLEAIAAGTSSTLPWTIGPSLRSLKAKVLRYPGHACQWRAFREAGLFDQEPLSLDGTDVVPRELFHALLEPRITAPEPVSDLVVARVTADGTKDGAPARAVVELLVERDARLGFSAMERCTGWHLALMTHAAASGVLPPGAHAVESVDPTAMIEAFRQRGLHVTVRLEVAG